MRIKEVRINGIRGFNYLKDDTSGEPAPHRILLNGKHLFLYGENGTGKSSLFDAIEWCLTGDIKESANRKIKDEKNFILNKFCSDNDSPFIQMGFIQNSGAVTEFKRTTTRGNPSFGYADEAEVCLIESNRIEQFVIDTKTSLWQRFSDLLGFEHLILFDNQLSRLKTESKNQYDDSKIKLRQLRAEFDKFNSDINELEVIFREELGDNWENNINMDSGSNEAEAFLKFEKLTDNIDKFIKNYKEFEIISTNLVSSKELLLQEKDASESSELTRIVSESYKYFLKFKEINKCPVCGQIIKFDEVLSRLKVLHDWQRTEFSVIFGRPVIPHLNQLLWINTF